MGEFVQLTWDHGIPLAFYVEGESGPKMKAPACRGCQERLRKIEDHLFQRLALAISPLDPKFGSIGRRAADALDPSRARKEKDRAARSRARERTRGGLFRPDSDAHVLPGFGPAGEGSRADALRVGTREVEALGHKLGRVALWFYRDGYLVPAEAIVATHVNDLADVSDVVTLVRERGSRHSPCVGACTTIFSQAGAHLMLFEIWERLALFVSVVPAGGSASHG